MFVFLVLSMLYPNDTLTGFAKAMKTYPAAQRYCRPFNLKRSLPVVFESGCGATKKTLHVQLASMEQQ